MLVCLIRSWRQWLLVFLAIIDNTAVHVNIGIESKPLLLFANNPNLSVLGPNCSFYSSEIFYKYSDMSDPGSIYRAIIDR